jgi:F0F1-type ATP synthase assembly protein I
MTGGNGSRGASGNGAKSSGSVGVSGTQFAGIGVQFGAVILVFTLAGYWLDKKLGTSPWFLLGCVFVGASAGFYSMYNRVTTAQRQDAADKGRRP